MAHMTRFGKLLWLFAALFVAGVLLVTWLTRSTLEDCGDLDQSADLSTWEHGARCRLRATVGQSKTISMGRVDSKAPGPAEFANVRFFARLGDTTAVAILPGDRPDVHAWYRGHDDSLTGFRFDVKGKLIEADRDVGYRGLGKGLRKKFGLPPDARLWIFDTAPEE